MCNVFLKYNSVFRSFFVVFVSIFLFLDAISQDYKSEADLAKNAEKLFEERNYVEALPLFAQLASLHPQNPNYNFKYGACLLFAGDDKEKPLKYLKFAISKPNVEPLAYYYYAKALHLNYYFPDAIKYYKQFIEKGEKKHIQEFIPSREIERCENGMQLLANIKEFDVVFKKNVKRDEFFRSYDVSDLGGKLVVVPDEFKSKLDKKKNEISVMYLPANTKDEVYFASYGDDGKNGKDIYRVSRLPDGKWGKPFNLGAPINTPDDEDFPFMHPDGKTLYFCSKGHNSMGGYDVFKTVYDPNTGRWSKPENLDFAISSPDDDIMYVTDMEGKLAFFASSRNAKAGEITVYRVSVLPKPAEYVIIKGKFIPEQNPNKSAIITVVDARTGEMWGKYNVNAENGQYMIVLPGKGGQYKFIVETTDDAPIHTGNVNVPRQTKVTALAQEIYLVGSGENEKLVIKNLFDKEVPFSMSDPELVEALIKKKAQLDITATEAEILEKTRRELETKKADELSGNDIPPSAEIKKQSDILIRRLNEKIADLQKQLTASYNLSNGKLQQAKEYKKKADELNKLAATAAPDEKQTLLKQSSEFEKKAKEAANIALAAKKMADMLNSDLQDLYSSQTDIQLLVNDVNLNLSKNNPKLAYQKLKEAEEKFNELAGRADTYLAEAEHLQKRSEELRNQRDVELKKMNDLNASLKQIDNQIANIEQQLSQAKKKKDKESLQQQLDALKLDKEDIAFQLEQQQKKLEEVNRQFLAAENEKMFFDQAKNELSSIPVNATSPKNDDLNNLSVEVSKLENQGLAGNYNDQAISQNENSSGQTNTSNQISLDQLQVYVQNNDQWEVELQELMSQNADEETLSSIEEKINKQYLELSSLLPKIKDEQQKQQLTQLIANHEKQIKQIRNLKDSLLSANQTDAVAQNNSGNTGEYQIPDDFDANNIIRQSGERIDNLTTDIDRNISLTDQEKIEQKIKILTEEKESIKEKELEIKMAWADEENAGIKENLGQQIIQLQEFQKSLDEKLNSLEQQQSTILAETRNTQENLMTTQDKNAEDVNNNTSLNNQNINITQKIKENEQQLTNIQNWIKTPQESKSNEDQYLKMKFFNEMKYENPLAAKTILEARKEKILLTDSYKKADNLRIQAFSEKDQAKKEQLIQQAEAIESENDAKILEIAQKYALANRTEYQNLLNMARQKDIILQNLADADEVARPSLLVDEAEIYYQKASELRKKAQNSSNTFEKQQLMQEAYENEILAIGRLQLANAAFDEISLKNNIEIPKEVAQSNQPDEENAGVQNISVNGNPENSIAQLNNTETADTSKNNSSNNQSNQNTAVSPVNNTTQIPPATDTNNSTKPTGNEIAENSGNEIKQSKNQSETSHNRSLQSENQAETSQSESLFKSSQTIKEALSLYEQEEKLLDNEIAVLKEQLNNTRKKKEKVNIGQKIDSMENVKSEIKQRIAKSAEVIAIWELSREESLNAAQEAELIYKKETSLTDQKASSFNQTDWNSLASEPDFAQWHNLKKEKRRLIKEALIEYESAGNLAQEADQLQQQANEFRQQALNTNNVEEKLQLLEKANTLDRAAEEKRRQSLEKMSKANEYYQEAINQENAFNLLASQLPENKRKQYDYLDKQLALNPEFLNQQKSLANNNLSQNNNIVNPTTQPAGNNANQVTDSTRDNSDKQKSNNDNRQSDDNFKNQLTAENNMSSTSSTSSNNETQPINKTTTNSSNITTGQGIKVLRNNNEITIFLEEFVVPANLTKDIFAKIPENTSAYDERRPIPENTRMPQGLVFTVQVGAFRNPIPQTLFKGFAPIWKEPSPSGLNRYLAGLFVNYDEAVNARNQIRKLGYDDAFVVAYLDGKRISYRQAMAMIGKNAEEEIMANIPGSQMNKNQSNTNPVSSNSPSGSENNPGIRNNQSNNNQQNNGVQANYQTDKFAYDIASEKGIFFTVQIGVFSKPVNLKELYGIDEIVYSETTSSGLYRYFVGKFSSPNDAQPLKNKMKEKGITDAFITAYKNGKKITLEEAMASSASNSMIPQPNVQPEVQSNYLIIIGEFANNVPGDFSQKVSQSSTKIAAVEKDGKIRYIYSTANNLTEAKSLKARALSEGWSYVKVVESKNGRESLIEETGNNPSSQAAVNNNSPETKPNVNTTTNNVSAQKIVYKVIIGEFDEEVPNDVAEIYLQLDDIESYTRGTTTVYTVGKFATFEQAIKKQEEMIQLGLTNSRIAKYNEKGEEIK